MLVIRLSRTGAVKRPFYHIVVADQRAKRDGRYVERLGFSNPMAAEGEENLRLDRERLSYWQERGARTSLAVRKLARVHRKQQSSPAADEAKPDTSAAPAASAA